MANVMTGRGGLAALPELFRGRRTAAVPRSSTERLWILGGTVAGLALVLIGYFLLIAPQRATTSDVNAQVATARAQQRSLQARLGELSADYKNLAKYEAQLAAAKAALPDDSGVSDLVRELHTISAQTSTSLVTVTVGDPTPVAAPAPAAAATAPAASTGTGMFSIPISVAVAGTPNRLNAFLEQLQEVQPRAVLVTHVTEASNADTGGSLTLSMSAFIAPGSGS